MVRPPPPQRAALVLFLCAALAPTAVFAQSRPRVLDHDDYTRWSIIREASLSPDGRWEGHLLAPADGPPRFFLRALPDGPTLEIERGHGALFTADSGRLLLTIDADATGPDDRVPDTLAVVDLERLRSAGPGEAGAGEAGAGEAVQRIPGLLAAQVAGPREAPVLAYRLDVGSGPVLVVRTPRGERRLSGAADARLSADGTELWYVREDPRGDRDGVYRMDLASGSVRPVLTGEAVYSGLTVGPGGRRAAFLSASVDTSVSAWRLHVALADGRIRTVTGGTEGELPPGWTVRGGAPLRFSASGERLFFGTTAPVSDAGSPEADGGVVVDVWSWNDPYIQPMQIERVREERERSWEAVVGLPAGPVVQLEEPGQPTLYPPVSGDEPWLLAATDAPYRRLLSWDGRYVDVYLVDPRTGARRRVLERIPGDAALSPTGRWITWWDGETGTWWTLERATGGVRALSADIPFPLHDEAHDRPGPPDPYGFAGWTEGDRYAVLYDGHDLWRADPSGDEAPVSLTGGVGRREGVRFRLAVADGPGVALPAAGRLLLSALELDTRDAGFWRARWEGGDDPLPLLMSPHHYGRPQVAATGDRLLFTRESFSDYPDLWVADGELDGLQRVSDANPQQADFRWGSEELVSWTGEDGRGRRGILYKPQDYDPTRRYPLLVNLYEQATAGFHRYHDPAPGGSSINRSFYVSRGYLVFAPDITYRVGEPGESVVDAVVPGVEALIDAGLAEPGRIGVQGHSWGGWETSYLLIRTHLFSAAVAGAPVANMTSAYGGVRWGSGMSRMFQYEREQSRIGATLWEARERYLENSPLFGADRIGTPLLVMHNDQDGAVPWEQGIELFSALRRLGKPAWMVDYNGEDHTLSREANRRDWAIRMQQFFDHYLLDQPAPVWLVEGIPARLKGRTLGLDLVEPAGRMASDDTTRAAALEAPDTLSPAVPRRRPAGARSPGRDAPTVRP